MTNDPIPRGSLPACPLCVYAVLADDGIHCSMSVHAGMTRDMVDGVATCTAWRASCASVHLVQQLIQVGAQARPDILAQARPIRGII